MSKRLYIWLLIGTLGCWTAQGTLYTSSLTVNAPIPDGDPSGYVSSVNLSGMQNVTVNVNVTLNISGGWNGDLYAYIQHGSGFTVLLNRVGTPSNLGFGYGDTGFNVTLSDAATQGVNIHNYQDDPSYPNSLNGDGQLTGTWRPDGSSLSSFNNLDPNGTWTIFFADLSNGEQSTLVSWGLEIEAVPEPITWALIIFLGFFAVIRLLRGRIWATLGQLCRTAKP